MKKKVKLHYGGSCGITLPKQMMIESLLWGDKTLEVEVVGNTLVLSKCEEGLSEPMKLIQIFGKSYFIEKRKEKCKLRRDERKRKWKEKLAQIKQTKQEN